MYPIEELLNRWAREELTVEQAVETVSAELKEYYPDAGGRAVGAIRAAYREAT